MRIGGSIEKEYKNPEEWYRLVEELQYRAVISPVDWHASREEKEAYLACAREHDLIIGEVGAWSNPLSQDEKTRKEALEHCKNQLQLAEELSAGCCVNIAGSRSEKWDGFSADNYKKDTYALIVDTVREIIDAVKPGNTFYTIEPMPWMVPSSPEEYLQLIHDVDREGFAVHLDFTNMINCPERFVHRDAFIEDCFRKLGPYIKSVHGKDVVMEDRLPCVIKETMPGKGCVDYQKVSKLCDGLSKDMTLFVEHLPDFESYKAAAAYVRNQAVAAGALLP